MRLPWDSVLRVASHLRLGPQPFQDPSRPSPSARASRCAVLLSSASAGLFGAKSSPDLTEEHWLSWRDGPTTVGFGGVGERSRRRSARNRVSITTGMTLPQGGCLRLRWGGLSLPPGPTDEPAQCDRCHGAVAPSASVCSDRGSNLRPGCVPRVHPPLPRITKGLCTSLHPIPTTGSASFISFSSS
jgi:hypothetical protein